MASTENWAVQRINDILATIRANIGAWQQAIVTDLGNSMSWADSSDNLYIGSTQYYIDTGGTSNYVNNDFGQVTLHDSLLVDQTISRSGGADDKIDFTDDSMAFTLGGVLGLTIEDDKVFTALDVGIGVAPAYRLDMSNGSATMFRASNDDAVLGNVPLYQYNRTANVTAGRHIARFAFSADNDAAAEIDYHTWSMGVNSDAAGAEEGYFLLQAKLAGADATLMSLVDGELHFNTTGKDMDIHLASSSNINMLVIAASNDRVGIDTATPSVTLDIGGAATSASPTTLFTDSLAAFGGGTKGRIYLSGTDEADILLNDVGGTADQRMFQMITQNTETIFRGLKDDATVQATFLYFDHVTGNVGLNSTSPVANLHISNSGNDTILLLTNAVTGATATDGGKIWMDSAVLDINNQSSGGTTFSIAGTEKMRIDNSGTSVGIGITNPNFYKDGADTFVIGTTTASADRGMTIVTANDSTGTLAWTDNTSTSPASIAVDHSTDAMTIRTGAATAITIDSSQNVGIGIASTYRLDVSTDALTIGRFVSTEAVGENAPLVKIGRNISATDGDILANFQWVGQNSATTETVFSSITGFATDVTDTTEDGTLIFYNSIAGSLTRMISLDTAVVINDSGADIDFRVEGDTVPNLLVTDAGNDRVGIGLDHPAVFMEIQDPGNNTTLRLSNAASPDKYAQFHATNYGYLNVTTSDSNTRVGINNAGPNYTLDVLGTSGPQIGAVHTDGSVQTTFETNSSGHMTIVPSGSTVNIEANTFTLGGGQDIDTTLNFNSSTNDGVFAWKNTEDYFSFSDDIHIFSTERLYLRDTAIYINSITDGHLSLTADTAIDFNATTTYVSGNIGINTTTPITDISSDNVDYSATGNGIQINSAVGESPLLILNGDSTGNCEIMCSNGTADDNTHSLIHTPVGFAFIGKSATLGTSASTLWLDMVNNRAAVNSLSTSAATLTVDNQNVLAQLRLANFAVGVDFTVDGSENLLIEGTGGVGIGVAPLAKLDILETTKQLRLSHTATVDYADFTVDSDGELSIFPSGGSIGLNTITPLDNVGTSAGDFSSAGQGLHVLSLASAGQLVVEGNTARFFMVDSDGATDDKIIRQSCDAGVLKWRSLNDDTTTRKDNILSMDLGTGFVGINNAAPDEALDVTGNITLSGDIIIGTSTADTYTLGEEFQAFTTGTNIGWAANPETENIYYKKTGKTVLVSVNIEGTSDSDASKGAKVTITMPFAKDANWRQGVSARTADNGAADDAFPGKVIWVTSTVLRVYRTFANSGWTNANKKEVEFSFTYQSA